MKTINTKSYLSMLCELIEDGKETATIVSGNSMYPFLRGDRDRVYLKKPDKLLKKGDIVLFRREDGDFILHRIRYIKDDTYYMVGDRQTSTEGPIKRSQIRAVVSKAQRKGKWIDSKNWSWQFYRVVWIRMVVIRPAIFSFMSTLSKIKHFFMSIIKKH